MKVGFIGLGTMGLPMTKNLIKNGFEVFVVSRSRQPIEEAVGLGAIEAKDPADLASKADVVLTCLPMPDTVEEVYLGERGILAGAREGMVLADHSTVSPGLNRKLYYLTKEMGVGFLDAPISGGPMGAHAGTLTIMCGGDKEIFDKAVPVFEAMGKNIFHVGSVGSGSVVKLMNNMLVGIHTAALSEAFVLGVKAGINPEIMRQIVKVSTGHSFMIDRVIDLIQDRDFNQRFSIQLLHKDMKIATQLGEQLEVPLELGNLSEKIIGEAMEWGYGGLDVAAIIRPLEEKAGVEVKRIP
ncbi:NAD(P)-dependent oxidoreductase [Microaerobacter geothermalis]|uniref:NAD(P)-dependent oxidoreductase n=1 Tax=Microaerobacter geothermalis TaxID=674972 RepID=UPI001F15FE6D|nr:NAD(P)-dependent oxidoreductase [Microaerobacter geothermalis]MCF6093546.1 NAD(P)-dependent oxidoreductase [Microaerobacter geothermalis]